MMRFSLFQVKSPGLINQQLWRKCGDKLLKPFEKKSK